MQSQRITVSVPLNLYQLLTRFTQKRQVSGFVAQAIEEKLLESTISKNPVQEFLGLRHKLPRKNSQEIIAAINQGR